MNLHGLLIAGWLLACSPAMVAQQRSFVEFLNDYISIKYPGIDMGRYLYVSVKHQKMYLIEGQNVLAEYTISTAKKGVGAEEDSEKTPLGLHRIAGKTGDDVPIGGVFTARQYHGKSSPPNSDSTATPSDDVTTRILWLSGTETGLNKGGNRDSYKRAIYIHGTPDEGLLGTPTSHGCIRMKNDEIIVLYQMIDTGTYVLILNN